MGALLTKVGAAFGQRDSRAQEIRALASQNISQGLAGYQKGREYLSTHQLNWGPGEGQLISSTSELERLRRAVKATADAMEQTRKRRPAVRRAPGRRQAAPSAALPSRPTPFQGRAN
jgi:hypothetical protein